MKGSQRNGFFSPPSTKRNLNQSLNDQELVKLINNLSSTIKNYYLQTKTSIMDGKILETINFQCLTEDLNDKISKSKTTFDKIENDLKTFLSEAKKIFQQLKVIHQKNSIKQELQSPLFKMPANQNNTNRLKQQILSPQKLLLESSENKTRNCEIGVVKKDEVNLSNSINNNFSPPLLLSEKSLELANKVIEFLQQLNPIQESVFNKKWDAEEKKKLFDVMKNDLYSLINTILSSNPQVYKSPNDINNIQLINKNNYTGTKNSLSGSNSKKQSKANSKVKSKSRPQKDYEKMESLLGTKEFMIQELNKDIKIKNETIHRNNTVIANLKVQIQNLQDDFNQKMEIINSAKTIKIKDEANIFKNKSLVNDIEKIKGQNLKLKSQCDNFQNLIREKDEKIRTLEIKNKELIAELRNTTDLSNKNRAKIQIDIKKNSETIKTLEKEIKQNEINYKEQISNLNSDNEKKQKIIEETKKTITNYENKIKNLNLEIENKKNEQNMDNSTKETTISMLKTKINQLQNDINIKETSIQNYAKEISDLTLKNQNLSEDIKNTKTLIEQQKDGQLNKEKEKINQILNENEKKMNIMKKSIEEKDNNIMNMKLTLEEKENAIEIMKKTLQEKESNLTSMKKTIEEKESVNIDLNTRFIQFKTEKHNLENKNQKLINEIQQLKSNLEEINQKNLELSNNLESITKTKLEENDKNNQTNQQLQDSLQKIISEKKRTIDQQGKQIKHLQIEINNINNENKKALQDYEQLIQEKTTKFDEIQSINNNLQHEINEIKNKHKNELNEKEQTLTNLKLNLENVLKENKDIQSKNEEANRNNKELQTKVDELNTEIEKLNKQISQLSQEIKSKNEEIQKLNDNSVNLSQINQNLQNKNSCLLQSIDNLNKELDLLKNKNLNNKEKEENKVQNETQSIIKKPSISFESHSIILDKTYQNKYRWFLLVPKEKEKETSIDIESFIWVSEDKIKDTLEKYNTFKSEKQIEEEQMNEIIRSQKAWLRKLEEKEDELSKVKMEKKQSTNLTASFGKTTKNKLFELNLVTKESDLANNNGNNTIPLEKYQTAINELNDANLRLAHSINVIDKLKNENKELSKIKDEKTEGISFINGGGNASGFLDDNFEIPEMKMENETTNKNSEGGDFERRINQIKSLLQLLIHEMDLNKRTKKIVIEICNIVGYNEEETNKFFAEKEKKGFKGLFKKKDK